MMRSAIIGAMVATAAAQHMTCPTSRSSRAAKGPGAEMRIKDFTKANCGDVLAEMKARIDGQSTTWHDPRKIGKYDRKYKVVTKNKDITSFSTSFETYNDKKYYEQIFTLTSEWNGGCKIEACSICLAPSVFDMGNNYCNLKMLYCGSRAGCTHVTDQGDLKCYGEQTSSFKKEDKTPFFSIAATAAKKGDSEVSRQVDLAKCLQPAAVPVQQAETMKCPDKAYTSWGELTGIKLTTVAETSCDKVLAEMKARVNGQKATWQDPRNKGVYTLTYKEEKDCAGTLCTSRLIDDEKMGGKADKKKDDGKEGGIFTNAGENVDEQIFTLTDEKRETCKIEACSSNPMGNSYCDLKMLYCGKTDECKPVANDFAVSIEKILMFGFKEPYTMDPDTKQKYLAKCFAAPAPAPSPDATVVAPDVTVVV